MIDKTTFTDQFGARLTRLADAVAQDDGGRIPGQSRAPRETVDVPDALWANCAALAGR